MAEFILSGFADEASSELLEQIRVCEENHIKFIEMRGVNGRNISAYSPGEAKEIRKILDDRGFRLSAVGSPYGKISIHDDFPAHLDHFKRTVEVAHLLGAKYMRIFSFYMDKDKEADSFKDSVLERLEKFLGHAGDVILAHENEKDIFGDIPQRCKVLSDAFGGRLKLVFDPANFVQCGVDVMSAYELLEDHVEYLHIKDAVAETGAVVPPGLGDGSVEDLLCRFSEKQGERFLSIEPHLRVFKGFSELESGDSHMEKEKFMYSSGEEAFCAAATHLKSLLCANGFTQSKDMERGYGIWKR